MVECDLAKVEVAGSNPVSRSNLRSLGTHVSYGWRANLLSLGTHVSYGWQGNLLMEAVHRSAKVDGWQASEGRPLTRQGAKVDWQASDLTVAHTD